MAQLTPSTAAWTARPTVCAFRGGTACRNCSAVAFNRHGDSSDRHLRRGRVHSRERAVIRPSPLTRQRKLTYPLWASRQQSRPRGFVAPTRKQRPVLASGHQQRHRVADHRTRSAWRRLFRRPGKGRRARQDRVWRCRHRGQRLSGGTNSRLEHRDVAEAQTAAGGS